jgi:hypothetical protein
MADAVQERIEREQRFASDVSHELRSPITALTAAVEVLDARRSDLPERTQQALDVVVSQVRRFDAMVIDLLELSRLEAGAQDLHPESVDIVELCDRVSQRFGYGELPIEVHRRANRRALVDRVRFERILGNLLDNATTTPAGRSGSRSSRRRSVGRCRSSSRTTGPVSPRANAPGSSNGSPAAARRGTASARGSGWHSSPSTQPHSAARRGSRIDPEAAPGSSSGSRRRRNERGGQVSEAA